MMSSTLMLYPNVVEMLQHCFLLLFFLKAISDVETLLLLCLDVTTLTGDVLRDVAAYVVAMSRH